MPDYEPPERLPVKLKYLDGWSKARRQNAEHYNHLFSNTEVITPYTEPYNDPIYNQYIIRVGKCAEPSPKSGSDQIGRARDELQEFLKKRNIGTAIYYPIPLHLQGCYTDLGYRAGDFPESESASRDTLALPIYAELTKEQQTAVVEAIKEFMEKYRI